MECTRSREHAPANPARASHPPVRKGRADARDAAIPLRPLDDLAHDEAIAARYPILILTGPPGAGKTTVARVLAERSERAVHLESDHFFHFIRSGYVEPWRRESREQNEVVMRIVAGAAAAYAWAGYFTIVDGIVLPRFFFEPLRDALREAGHEVAYVILRAPLEVCLARAGSRDSQPPADPQVVEQLWRGFAELGPLAHHAIDVDAEDADGAADLVEARLRSGSLRA